ncbi:MAG: single-stranded-DNA-specific exonuclease RecJ [Planctomycetes bacterium]|nr:single-stranded-DNA-specific exonuclease RecJ [Planctomycetota bacterium]
MTVHWRFYPDDLRLQEDLARQFSLSRLAARILINRGLRGPDDVAAFMSASLEGLTDPFRMAHMERAVDRLVAALARKETIVVYGDSDVDGVSGTALLAGFLRAVRADVATYTPNRLEEGYSLTPRGEAFIRDRGAKVVITVDNGTTAVDAIARLQADGIDVIVCDHHEPGERLPPALALLNPKWDGCGYPFRWLCGTAVGFRLLTALATRLPARANQHETLIRVLRHSIGLVALATICDCVPLVGENRALARSGLAALSSGEHPGVQALLRIAGVHGRVQQDDVSFRLGPRINAAGRLGHAERALELLLAADDATARACAKELDERNQTRQDIEAHILQGAREKAAIAATSDAPILVLADEGWHPGVVGIVASRIATEFQRPTILIGMRGASGRGSGRSVRGFDLHHALAQCAKHLRAFGGHAFAAGLEVDAAALPAFIDAVNAAARTSWKDDPDQELWIDAEVPLGVLTPSLMAELERLAPFGEGHPLPTFVVPDVQLGGAPRRVGRNQNHLTFPVLQSGVVRNAIAYGMGPRADSIGSAERFSVAFTPRLNLFRGKAGVDLEVKDIRVA